MKGSSDIVNLILVVQYVQQFFQMTISKILQVSYLTLTDTSKLVDHWKIIVGLVVATYGTS